MFRNKICRETQNTHFVFNHFLPKIFPIRKNIVQPDRPQMTIQHGACALYA